MQTRNECRGLDAACDTGHLADIRTDDERLRAGAGYHGGAQPLLCGKLRHRSDELVHQRAVHRTQIAGIAERHVSDDALGPFIEANADLSIVGAFQWVHPE